MPPGVDALGVAKFMVKNWGANARPPRWQRTRFSPTEAGRSLEGVCNCNAWHKRTRLPPPEERRLHNKNRKPHTRKLCSGSRHLPEIAWEHAQEWVVLVHTRLTRCTRGLKANFGP